jgi:hypothetical protein
MTDVLKHDPRLQPIYEVIKREDMQAAFTNAIAKFMASLQTAITDLLNMLANPPAAAPWTWGGTSRWSFDVWQ